MLISIGELISKSFAFTKEHWKKYMVYMVVMLGAAIPYGVFFMLKNYSFIFSLLALISYVALIYIGVLINIAITKSTQKILNNQPVEAISEALKNAKPLFWSLLWVNILMGLIVGLGSIIIIPGIIFAIWYAFAGYEFIFNNLRGMEALNASKKLVQGRWWSVLWRIIVPVLPVYGVIIVLAIISAIFSLISEMLGTVVYVAGAVVISFATIPYAACYIQVLYQDLKSKSVSAPAPAQK